MKTTFGRTICTTVIILLAALLLLGTSFQASVKEYLTETVVSSLEENATVLSDLASAYYSEGSLLNQQDFMVNLDVVSRITNADAVIGERAVVIEPIDNLAGKGQVKVKGQIWTARAGDNDAKYAKDEVLSVVAIEGVKLICKK